ncbi:T9SS type B sorting domain-containing protein [Tenacibaculum crassostreae]|uniref:T9SS type B sorting domain-containing protein n=1 Tax=Tenacibaculum crassostreae TaxID=502683 RepID=UPI003896044B
MKSSNNNTQINFSEINICVGEQLNLNAASGLSYKWTGPNGFSSSEQNPIISNVSDVNSGLYHLTFSDSSLCTQIKTINVIVSSPPEIDSLEDIDTCDFNNDGYATFDLSKINTEILSSNNDLVVEFLNGSNNLIDSSELSSYKNTIPNEEIITVKVSHKNNPNCFNFTSFKLITIVCVNPDPDPVPEENIIYFPSFFTPNNDSKNDNWPNNINNKLNIKSITIYDRFGKKIKTLTQFDVGWDGNQQGKTMPTNDYWFKAITLKGEIITGHFSLLRK